MANICDNSITIVCDNEAKLEEFFNIIEKTLNSKPTDDSSPDWVGNVLKAFGIEPNNENLFNYGKYGDLYTRGFVLYANKSAGNIFIDIESKWSPCVKAVAAICDKFFGENEYGLTYYSEECGCEIYETNDDYYENMYNVDYYQDDENVQNNIDEIIGETYCAYKDDIVKFVQTTFNTAETDFEKLVKIAQDHDVYIHQWKIAEVEDAE